MNIRHYPTVDSTNRLALAAAAEGAPHGTVIWADEQTGGRGQYGRDFYSPPGGLYFSLIVRPYLNAAKYSLITLAAGVACARILSTYIDTAVSLKWPNDLILNGKKAGGILCESGPYDHRKGSFPFAVIGIGINVHGTVGSFPGDVCSFLTTIQQESGELLYLEDLLHSLVKETFSVVEQLCHNPDIIMAEWRKYDYLYGKSVLWTRGSIVEQGFATGLVDDGRYSLRDQAGQTKLILSGSLRVNE